VIDKDRTPHWQGQCSDEEIEQMLLTPLDIAELRCDLWLERARRQRSAL
jgi:hypothetical protein